MSPVARFGLFEADLEEGALRKNGRIIKLQHQPFEVLRVLVEHPNQVVSRDELRARLWPSDIVVDFDQSLNKSIAKLRDALGDSATSPRFIETVPKRGYRFIAPVAISCANDIVPAHQWYAYLLSAMGRHAEAEQAAMRAAASDRLSLNAATSVGYVQYAARDFDKAASTLRRVLEVDPDFVQARRNLGLVLTMQGKHAEAVAECERVLRLTGDAPASLADLAWARGQAGDRDGARRILRELEARSVKQYIPGDVLAKALLGAGYNERAIDALAQAFESHVATLTSLAVDPVWDELRESPKVKGLTMRVQRGPVIGRRNVG